MKEATLIKLVQEQSKTLARIEKLLKSSLRPQSQPEDVRYLISVDKLKYLESFRVRFPNARVATDYHDWKYTLDFLKDARDRLDHRENYWDDRQQYRWLNTLYDCARRYEQWNSAVI